MIASPAPAASQGAFRVLHSFSTDGANPSAPLIQATDGSFYGTTYAGGANNAGTIFKMTARGVVTTVHTFAGGSGDGAHPVSALLQWSDGNFYGTTMDGGDGSCPGSAGVSGCGTVFRMTPAGDVTLLHSFTGPPDGAHPAAELVAGTDGNFYGTTQSGGTGLGTVFRMTPGGEATILHRFAGRPDGASPAAALVQGTDGDFYGTTSSGGSSCSLSSSGGCGTVFRISAAGGITILHRFTGGNSGARPSASLIQGIDGHFYGTTTCGGLTVVSGVCGTGTIFRITASGDLTVLHAFGGDFAFPAAPLLQTADGTFYGTASAGISTNPAAGYGGVFKMTADARVTALHVFRGAPNDGANSQAALIRGTDGHLYGTTVRGGTDPEVSVFGTGKGVVFRLAKRAWGATDVDGDRQADLMVWRPGTATFHWLTSTSGYDYAGARAQVWGSPTHVPLTGDMDGDEQADLITWRPDTGVWSWLTSSSGFTVSTSVSWGNEALGDVPALGDIDGDGKGDLIVWRASTGTWYWLTSSTVYNTAAAGEKQWGNASLGDQPLLGDFDRDGRSDLVVWRATTGMWYWLTSASGYSYTQARLRQWGNQAEGDVPLTDDFDIDGLADLVVWRASTGTWYWLLSSTFYSYDTPGQKQWGSLAAGDVPRLADFDDDGKPDLTVWRASTGTWYWLPSSSGYHYPTARAKQWGSQSAGDIPLIR